MESESCSRSHCPSQRKISCQVSLCFSLFRFFAKLQERKKKGGRGKRVNSQRVSYAHMVWLYVCRKEAVTLPENKETDFGDIEQSRNFSNTTATTGFQQTTYFALVCNRPPWHCQMTKLYLLFIHDQLFY